MTSGSHVSDRRSPHHLVEVVDGTGHEAVVTTPPPAGTPLRGGAAYPSFGPSWGQLGTAPSATREPRRVGIASRDRDGTAVMCSWRNGVADDHG